MPQYHAKLSFLIHLASVKALIRSRHVILVATVGGGGRCGEVLGLSTSRALTETHQWNDSVWGLTKSSHTYIHEGPYQTPPHKYLTTVVHSPAWKTFGNPKSNSLYARVYVPSQDPPSPASPTRVWRHPSQNRALPNPLPQLINFKVSCDVLGLKRTKTIRFYAPSDSRRLLVGVYCNVILSKCSKYMMCIPIRRTDQIFPSSAFTLKACLPSIA